METQLLMPNKRINNGEALWVKQNNVLEWTPVNRLFGKTQHMYSVTLNLKQQLEPKRSPEFDSVRFIYTTEAGDAVNKHQTPSATVKTSRTRSSLCVKAVLDSHVNVRRRWMHAWTDASPAAQSHSQLNADTDETKMFRSAAILRRHRMPSQQKAHTTPGFTCRLRIYAHFILTGSSTYKSKCVRC